MIYFVTLFILLVPVLIYDFMEREQGKRLWYYAELLILIFLVGLRYRVGGDTLVYIELFDDYPTFTELFDFDFVSADFNPLWYVFNAIIKSIWNDFTFFQIVHAVVVNGVFFWFFRKYTKYFFTAIVLYYIPFYLLYNTEVLRESLAVCVLMLSFSLLLKRKYFKYFICCLIALGFHYSALMLFVIPFILSLPKISWKITLLAFGLLFVVLSVSNLGGILQNVFSANAGMSFKVDAYTVGGFFDVVNVRGVLANVLPIILLLYVNQNTGEKSNMQNNEFIINFKVHNLLFVYAMFACITMFVPTMFMRLQNYIVPFYIIVLASLVIPAINSPSDKQKLLHKILLIFTTVWFLFFGFRMYWGDDSNEVNDSIFLDRYYPYYSVFDPTEHPLREN